MLSLLTFIVMQLGCHAITVMRLTGPGVQMQTSNVIKVKDVILYSESKFTIFSHCDNSKL